MTRRVFRSWVLCGAIGLAACSAPGAPAPVGSSPEASPTTWTWQSAEPITQASKLAVLGGDTSSASPSDTVSPLGEAATRRLAYQPGVAGQPMVAVGACVDLQRADDGYTTYIDKPCDQPHHAQVVGYIDINDPPQSPAPPLHRLQAFAAHHCPILGGEFIGAPLQDRQDLTVNWTGPSRREWGGGARTLLCMLSGPPKPDGHGTQSLTTDLRG